MNYIPISDKDKQEMLNSIGVKDTQELLSLQIPEALRVRYVGTTVNIFI